MKKILFSLVLLASISSFTQSHAVEPIKTEAMLILLAAVSAEDPEVAAVVDVLGLLLVPSSPEYQTDTQRTIAYIGLATLAVYNHDAKDEERSKEDIFAVNLVVFNIILAGELFGLNDSSSNYNHVEEAGSTFNFQLSTEGAPRLNWHYRF